MVGILNLYGYVVNDPVNRIDLEPSSTVGGDDEGFNDPSIIEALENELKDPATSWKRKKQIEKRLREKRTKKKKMPPMKSNSLMLDSEILNIFTFYAVVSD